MGSDRPRPTVPAELTIHDLAALAASRVSYLHDPCDTAECGVSSEDLNLERSKGIVDGLGAAIDAIESALSAFPNGIVK